MARRASGHGALQKAKKSILRAETVAELRVAQAVLLPLELGLSMEQTASAVGRSRSWVIKERLKFIRSNGILSAPIQDARGGRRREIVPVKEEIGYVIAACEQAAWIGLLFWQSTDFHVTVEEANRPIAKYLKANLEDFRGKRVGLATAYKMLDRTAQKEFRDGTVKDWTIMVEILIGILRA